MQKRATYVERHPRESERAWLQARVSSARDAEPWYNHLLIAEGIGIFIGLPLFVPLAVLNKWLYLGIDNRWLMVGAFIIGIALATIGWTFEVRTGKRYAEQFVGACRDALANNRVESITVQADAAYKIEYKSEEVDGRSDWGLRYLIRMDDGRAIVVSEVEDADWPNTTFEVVRTCVGKHIITINKLGDHLPDGATIDPTRDRGKLAECEPVDVDWDAILTGKADI